MEPTKEQPGVVANGRAARLRRDLVPLYALAAAVLCAAGSWYLLKELAPLLRPLILAVFLAYTILPAHRALCRRVPAKLSGPLLALLVAAVVLGLAVVIYGNLVDLKSDAVAQTVPESLPVSAALNVLTRESVGIFAAHSRPYPRSG